MRLHLYSATPATISKLVTVVEIVKRHIPDLQQLNALVQTGVNCLDVGLSSLEYVLCSQTRSCAEYDV